MSTRCCGNGDTISKANLGLVVLLDSIAGQYYWTNAQWIWVGGLCFWMVVRWPNAAENRRIVCLWCFHKSYIDI